MKKLLLIIAFLTFILCVNAQNQIKREGNTFSKEVVNKKTEPINTGYFWEDSKGIKYPIMCNPKTGSCFIIRTSQVSGKKYPQYLDKEIRNQIIKEIGLDITISTASKK